MKRRHRLRFAAVAFAICVGLFALFATMPGCVSGPDSVPVQISPKKIAVTLNKASAILFTIGQALDAQDKDEDAAKVFEAARHMGDAADAIEQMLGSSEINSTLGLAIAVLQTVTPFLPEEYRVYASVVAIGLTLLQDGDEFEAVEKLDKAVSEPPAV